MADYDSSLPIRSEADGTDERVHSKIVDYADPGGADKQLEVSEKLAHVRAFGEDSGNVKRQVKLSESGNVALDGDYDVTNNSNPSSAALIAHDRNAAPDETHQNKRVTAVAGADDTVCLDMALRDESGQPYTGANPLPVTLEASEGAEVEDYDTASAVASDASDNHDYTVSGAVSFFGSRIWSAASGKMKIEVQLETAAASGVFNTKYVAFNSTANPNIDIQLDKIGLTQVTGAIVRIVRTNLDNQAQDLYSTIVGVER